MLFKIQSALYLLELSDDRDLLVVGQVLDELLGYCRAAAAGKSGSRAEGTQPVDAVMLFKALILKADESVFEILRHLIGIDPYSVLLAVELSHFNELIVAVIGIDERGLVLIRLVVVEIYRDLAVGKGHDIEENITSDYRRGEHTDDEHTEYDQQSYPAGFFIRLFILLF